MGTVTLKDLSDLARKECKKKKQTSSEELVENMQRFQEMANDLRFPDFLEPLDKLRYDSGMAALVDLYKRRLELAEKVILARASATKLISADPAAVVRDTLALVDHLYAQTSREHLAQVAAHEKEFKALARKARSR